MFVSNKRICPIIQIVSFHDSEQAVYKGIVSITYFTSISHKKIGKTLIEPQKELVGQDS